MLSILPVRDEVTGTAPRNGECYASIWAGGWHQVDVLPTRILRSSTGICSETKCHAKSARQLTCNISRES